jgi:hypothetical protein
MIMFVDDHIFKSHNKIQFMIDKIGIWIMSATPVLRGLVPIFFLIDIIPVSFYIACFVGCGTLLYTISLSLAYGT